MAERIRYSLPVAVFMVIMNNQNEILMLQRSNTGRMDGMWSIPAWSLDENEELSVAAKREAMEELWIQVVDCSLLHVCHCNVHGKQWINMFFKAHVYSWDVKLCEPHKHSAIAWNAMGNLPDQTIDYVRFALENIAKWELYGSFGW